MGVREAAAWTLVGILGGSLVALQAVVFDTIIGVMRENERRIDAIEQACR